MAKSNGNILLAELYEVISNRLEQCVDDPIYVDSFADIHPALEEIYSFELVDEVNDYFKYNDEL